MFFAPYEIPSKSHFVLLSVVQTSDKVIEVIRESLAHWKPVWVVVEGDQESADLKGLCRSEKNLRVLHCKPELGHGGAILHALDLAHKKGFTHVLCMEADGRHPVVRVRDFISLSMGHPQAMIMGTPEFDSSVPWFTVQRRKLMNFLMQIETAFAGVGDAMFGYKLYPVGKLHEVMHGIRTARHNDFAPEVAVRLVWAGVQPVRLACDVRKLTSIPPVKSPWQRLRDWGRLGWMHVRLLAGFLRRLPSIRRWRRWQSVESKVD
jgi:hypothetical protein